MTHPQPRRDAGPLPTTTSDQVAQCLDRIEHDDPDLMAVITVLAESAIAAADRCDQADDTDAKARPFHGWPIAVKDNIEVAGTRTTSGSPIFTRHVATRDSAVISRLREAGAVFIAKTNLSELAIGPTTQNTGWHQLQPPTRTRRAATTTVRS